jgi:hypothetical protein
MVLVHCGSTRNFGLADLALVAGIPQNHRPSLEELSGYRDYRHRRPVGIVLDYLQRLDLRKWGSGIILSDIQMVR